MTREPEETFDGRQCVYFASAPGGPIKIGTSINPRRRLTGIRGQAKTPVQLLAWVLGDRGIEKLLHVRLSRHRDTSMPGREWFRPTTEVLAVLGAAVAGTLQDWVDEAEKEFACHACNFIRRPCSVHR